VKEFLSATHSTNATVITVELLLCRLVIKEYTLHATVDPKSHKAVLTMLTDRLPCVAQSTHKLFHIFALQIMPLLGILYNKTVHQQTLLLMIWGVSR